MTMDLYIYLHNLKILGEIDKMETGI
jgi:hypothetical protein